MLYFGFLYSVTLQISGYTREEVTQKNEKIISWLNINRLYCNCDLFNSFRSQFGEDSTETIAGYDWYYWNDSNDDAVIFLYGGYGSNLVDYCLIEIIEDYAPLLDVVNYLHTEGYDVICGAQNWLNYSIAEENDAGNQWLTDTAEWLHDEWDYTNVYLFGFSAGAIATAYEIQKEGADEIYTAAVVAGLALGRDDCGDLYNTEYTAENAVVPTAFICHEEDETSKGYPPENSTYNASLRYYNNMPYSVGKQWHKWGDINDHEDDPYAWCCHDVFPNTCIDCVKTVSEVCYDWFTRDTFELTVVAKDIYYNPIAGGVPVKIDDEYFVWTNDEPIELYEGWHVLEVGPAWNGAAFHSWTNTTWYPLSYDRTMIIDMQANTEYWVHYVFDATDTYNLTVFAQDRYYEEATLPVVIDGGDFVWSSDDPIELYEGWHVLEVGPAWNGNGFDTWWQVGTSNVYYETTIIIDLQSNQEYQAYYFSYPPPNDTYNVGFFTTGDEYQFLDAPITIDGQTTAYGNDTYILYEGWHVFEVPAEWDGLDFWWCAQWQSPYNVYYTTTMLVDVQSNDAYWLSYEFPLP